MNEARLSQLLGNVYGQTLASELSASFLQIRADFATKTLERASPGKFVETFVQCLQKLATGTHDNKPDVDAYLGKQAENATVLPDGLRICAARIARSIYTLRNKRNIAHKNDIDPNSYDLMYIHQGAAWIMAELIRNASGVSMQEAGILIELVQAPVGSLVEEIDGTRLVHAKLSVKGEILVLLHSHYPDYVSLENILKSMIGRSESSIRNRLTEMCRDKLLHRDGKRRYRLTSAGHDRATNEIAETLT